MVWKSVNDSLPPEFEEVLIYTVYGFFIAWYDQHDRWDTGEEFFISDEVTHWMHLVKPLNIEDNG